MRLQLKESLSPVKEGVQGLFDQINSLVSQGPQLSVPMKSDRAQTWQLNTFLDSTMRISRGDGGECGHGNAGALPRCGGHSCTLAVPHFHATRALRHCLQARFSSTHGRERACVKGQERANEELALLLFTCPIYWPVTK